jgi:hypothetical protein
MGIKGQYLILDTGVINMRRHAGYDVAFSVDQERLVCVMRSLARFISRIT